MSATADTSGGGNPYERLNLHVSTADYLGSSTLSFVMEAISAPQPRAIELIGLPGMGKSTLLRYLADPDGAMKRHTTLLMPQFRRDPLLILPVYVDFRVRSLAIHPFAFLAIRFAELVKEWIATRRSPRLRLSLSHEIGTDATPEASMDWLESHTRRVASAGARPVLLLDDFELAFKELTLEQTTRLRPLRDHVAFVIATDTRLERANPQAAGSPFFTSIPLHAMNGLSEEDARRMINNPLKGVSFPEADCDALLRWTGRYPHLLVLAAQALWDIRDTLQILKKPSVVLPSEHRDMLRGRLQDDFEMSFITYWDRLDERERTALTRLAKHQPLEIDDRKALGSLRQRGLVAYDVKAGTFAIASEILADWVAGKRNPAELAKQLTDKEGALYTYLRENIDRVCSFEELGATLWTGVADRDTQLRRRTQVVVSRLRKRLQEQTGEDIESVRDTGYRLVAPRNE